MLTCGPWNSQVWELAGWLRCEWSLKTFLHSWHWESSIRWKSSCVLESCSMSKGIPMLISLNCFSNMHHLVFPKRLPPPGKDLLLSFLVYPKFSVHIKAWALVAGCRVSRVYNSVPIKVRWEAEVLLHVTCTRFLSSELCFMVAKPRAPLRALPQRWPSYGFPAEWIHSCHLKDELLLEPFPNWSQRVPLLHEFPGINKEVVALWLKRFPRSLHL